MYRITIEKYELKEAEGNYKTNLEEVNKTTVFEQVFEQLEIKTIAQFVNNGVNS